MDNTVMDYCDKHIVEEILFKDKIEKKFMFNCFYLKILEQLKIYLIKMNTKKIKRRSFSTYFKFE